MTVNKYITLTTSNASLSKRFAAIEFSPPLERMDTIEYTLGGKTDKQAGPVIQMWRYTLRIPIDTPPTNYGTYGDFITFFNLSNANATPSDVITLTDHWGNTHSVYFSEGVQPSPLTTFLEGVNAWFIVPVSFVEKN